MIGSRAYESFAKPVLHLVIAEDEELWSERLKALAEPLRQWSLSRTGQFDLKVHTCRSVEAFKDLVGSRLAANELVYATLDLGMPLLESDNRFSEKAGKEMVRWCLEQRKKGEHLEFCLVSARETLVETLYRENSDLESQRVKRIYKSEIEGWPAGQARLLDMVTDVENFVRFHLPFCTVNLPGRSERVPIWFGGEEPLVRLLGRADRLAAAEEAGVYILFADAGGYEIDWVRLCCELRGLRFKELDVRSTNRESNPEWSAPFDDPPEAFLVRNLDYARNQGCNITPFLENGFFDKVEQRNSLAFFQFPLLETQLDVSKRLEEKIELPILEACLTRVYKGETDRSQNTGFAFESHRRIVSFPTYEALRRFGVVRKVIEFQVMESCRHLGCEELGIDPELFEVLAEIPWDSMDGGLQKLRSSIDSACMTHVAGKRAGKLLGEDSFKGDKVVPGYFIGELGFCVRGRRLYSLLEKGSTQGHAERWSGFRDPEQALDNLETLSQLYNGLTTLQQMGGGPGHQPASPEFTAEDYKALHDAWSFLDNLFENPATLRLKIAKFRDHMSSSAWRSYYPTLESRRSKAAVENIRFSWPFTRLPLHPAVAAYLLRNRVRALIHRDTDEFLARYPDLACVWEKTAKTRDDLFEVIMQREEERETAEFYARERHNQPVLVHLVPHMSQDEPRSPFDKIFESFLIFNSFLAMAENHHVFSLKAVPSRETLKKILNDKVNQGPMVNLLCHYKEWLASSDRAEDSVFYKWKEGWAVVGHQQDAVRLAKQIAEGILESKYRRSLSNEHRSLVSRIAQLDHSGGESKLGIGTLLNFFLIIRNKFYKNAGGDFEFAYGRHLRDLLRRLVAATTADYRLGKVDEGGTSISLWRKNAFETAEPAKLITASARWPNLWVLAKEVVVPGEEADVYEELFPIHDLIRVHPDKGSVWAYYNERSVWKNLTHMEGSDEDPQLSAEEGGDWLPDKGVLENSELWRSIHHD